MPEKRTGSYYDPVQHIPYCSHTDWFIKSVASESEAPEVHSLFLARLTFTLSQGFTGPQKLVGSLTYTFTRIEELH